MFKRLHQPSVEIVSAATTDVHWWPEVRAHHRRYAQAHGYVYTGLTMPPLPDRSQVWLKFAALRDRLRQSEAEWLFWLDADAVFWDFARPLHGFVPPLPWEGVFPQFWKEERDFVSAGAFFIRNCDNMRELLDEVWERGQGGPYGSEETELTGIAPFSACHILLVDNQTFNSLPTVNVLRRGISDFIMHAAFLQRHRTGFLRDIIACAEKGMENSRVKDFKGLI